MLAAPLLQPEEAQPAEAEERHSMLLLSISQVGACRGPQPEQGAGMAGQGRADRWPARVSTFPIRPIALYL